MFVDLLLWVNVHFVSVRLGGCPDVIFNKLQNIGQSQELPVL